jgi:hypothetical protein
VKLLEFRYGDHRISYPEKYYQFLKEVYIFDIYRVNLLKENDLVLDLGASIGDFSILASNKVGKNGKIIAVEPNIDDYELLKMNIKKNDCQNVIPLNLGVGSQMCEKEITFWGTTFKCTIKTLESILKEVNVNERINFIKMDIEGFEVEVIRNSINIVKEADAISMECHSTKKEVDQILLPHGFEYKPITYSYCYKKMIRNLFSHPIHFCRAAVDSISKNPSLIDKTIRRYDLSRDQEVNGTYVKVT